jgi:HEAT repeat protein
MRLEAIEAIGRLNNPRAVGFLTKLLDENSVPRDAIFRALGQLGRPAALTLKQKLDDPDPAERRRALDALLPMANADDLGALYTYIQKYPPDGAAKTEIYDKIATIEAHQYERPLGTGH